MTTDLRALDNQLSYLLSMSNGALGAMDTEPEAHITVRVHLGAALGMLAGFSPEAGGDVLGRYSAMLVAAEGQDDLYALQRMIFDAAFTQLNALNR